VELLVPSFINWQSSLENQLRALSGVKLELTGEIPLNFDIRKASADDVRRGESLVIPATLALLLVAFGQPDRRLIPLAVGQLCHRDHSGNYGIPGAAGTLSILVQNLYLGG